MAKKGMEFNVEIDPTMDEIFDEGVGNSFLALRRLRWNENSPFKIDIRKWFTNSDGEEIAGKGVAFITEEGPGELIKALIKHDFGDTKEILEQLSQREDFNDSLSKLGVDTRIIGTASSDDFYYDPKELIGNE